MSEHDCSPKILIVDDDYYFAKRLGEDLSDRGYKVSIAGSVEECLGKVKGESFDLFVVDLMLPNNPQLSGISEVDSRAGFLAGKALIRKLREVTVACPHKGYHFLC